VIPSWTRNSSGLSPACNFLKGSDIPNDQKFDKWLQILPLMSRYFPEKQSSLIPEPPETAGVYITYRKTFFDLDKLLNAFQNQGIRVDVLEDCRTCKTTSFFVRRH
jgi:hypothetical protein